MSGTTINPTAQPGGNPPGQSPTPPTAAQVAAYKSLLRDFFAGMALAGSWSDDPNRAPYDVVATEAYQQADAMLALSTSPAAFDNLDAPL